MTVKDELRQLIETLDEDAAAEALSFVRVLVAEQSDEAATDDNGRGGILKVGKPTSENDPLWEIVGMVGDEYTGPTDVASNKHKYLAEIYADLHDE